MSNYKRHYDALKYAMEKIAESPVADCARELYLYGSFSRGDYTWNSDIDLLLSLNEGQGQNLKKDIHLLKSEVSRDELDAVEVDLKIVFGDEWKSSPMTYYKNVRWEGKKLW